MSEQALSEIGELDATLREELGHRYPGSYGVSWIEFRTSATSLGRVLGHDPIRAVMLDGSVIAADELRELLSVLGPWHPQNGYVD